APPPPTFANATLLRPIIDRFNSSATSPIRLHLLPFPSAAAGLPEGCESFSSIFSDDHLSKFIKGIAFLHHPFDLLLKELRPDFVVSDFFLPWTHQVCAQNGVQRIVFDGSSLFARCAFDSIQRHKVIENLQQEAESFVLPDLPHHIELLRSQVEDPIKSIPSVLEIFNQAQEVDSNSYGLVVNSFYELEQDYVEHFRKVMGRKAWLIGPATLCNQEGADMFGWRGETKVGEECVKWLDGRKQGSVVYMCFGSISAFTAAQLREMELGLEASSHPFVWAVRNAGEDWIPEGYMQRIEGRGLLINGWAPQQLILNHAAVGGFITHCGWNSCLAGINAGLPMGTWPLFAEQFFKERLLVDVLKIGVAVGSKVFGITSEDRPVIKAAALEAAVRNVMGEGGEAEKMRKRANELKEMARSTMEGGGGLSYSNLENLILELMEKKEKKARAV
ncbi:scopoletin glucosyltransferase-like, partial [Phalaenopsis equestris]|uniref:scopoletin glucosyltransferase-like n=1 Tax=Phalaenopsis equestris TaxID=78828 RepID=UPI0009E5D849